ncbi:penta-EF hand family protein [Halococcus agarilyticus]|uniref:hypothetical protein n=1 Tax=Halococcus agarilyticus TaxID=1232219 RepID=UPI0006782D9F|nr:hypothetical protein [Halococcus agarilyticus]
MSPGPLRRLWGLFSASAPEDGAEEAYRCIQCGAGFDREYQTCRECGGSFIVATDAEQGDADLERSDPHE